MSGDRPIAWIDVVPPDRAAGDLAEAYDSVMGADGKVENLYLAMSLTPKAIQPADAHYLAILHNPDNPLEPWLGELVATYVALLCGCRYAVANHGTNFRMCLQDDARADAILQALREDDLSVLEGVRAPAAIRYAKKLSLTPDRMTAEDLTFLREAGFSDKEISYLIQIAASFAYWARMINGLGTRLGDTVGFAALPAAEAPEVR